MRAIDRKLIRDAWHMRGQLLAIGAVIGCGVATFVMSLSTLQSLEGTQETYYDRHAFADVFAQMKRAPRGLMERVLEIPGVGAAETRVVREVVLDVPGFIEPVSGRLISFPVSSKQKLNRLHLRQGRLLAADRPGEVLVDESFALAHGLKPGDALIALLNGRRQELRIVGIVLSPEHIYQVRTGDILPDAKRFGIVWMSEQELSAAFDMLGAFNDVSLRLLPGASQLEVIRRLDELFEPYGSLGAYGRDDQSSHVFVRDEIRGLRGMAVVVPLIFLAVAAFLLNVVLSRLIGTQREQIAMLKAFGYTCWEIGMHYAKLILLVAFLSAAAGTAGGAWLGSGLTALYTDFFHFPSFQYVLPLSVVVLAFGVSAAAALLGALSAVRRAMRLPPAEAMRPEPPAQFRPTLLERLGLQRLFPPLFKMILRTLERQPGKAALSILGIALAVAVLVLGNFGLDAINHVIDLQFNVAQRQDASVTFVEPIGAGALHDLKHLPGVQGVEPFRAVAVRLRCGARARRLGIQGLRPGNEMFRIVDIHGKGVALPKEGLLLSVTLARILGVRAGESVLVEVLEGPRPTRWVPVAGTVEDFSGLNAYMSIVAVNRLLEEGPVISGAFITVESGRMDELFPVVKEVPRIAALGVKDAARRNFRQTIAENMLRMRFFNILFAGVIAFGVVYNNARIALSERSREFATLRVIGFTRREVSLIFLGELALLTLAAVPLGLALGYGFAALMTLAYDTELFRIPLVIHRSTYGFSSAVVLTAALLSGLIVRRRIDRLDLVAVLKSKD